MNEGKINIYFMPGLAAGPEIFDNLYLNLQILKISNKYQKIKLSRNKAKLKCIDSLK